MNVYFVRAYDFINNNKKKGKKKTHNVDLRMRIVTTRLSSLAPKCCNCCPFPCRKPNTIALARRNEMK